MTYVELHAHSAYSFLDGASQPEELAARAAELGYEALALTDHDGVYGSLEFAHAAKHFGVRPITGAEVTLEGGAHVTLLVESARGYSNLAEVLRSVPGFYDVYDLTFPSPVTTGRGVSSPAGWSCGRPRRCGRVVLCLAAFGIDELGEPADLAVDRLRRYPQWAPNARANLL